MSLQPLVSALLFHLEAVHWPCHIKKPLSLRLCCGYKIQLKYNIITKQCNSKVWLYVYFTPGFRIVVYCNILTSFYDRRIRVKKLH